MICNCLSVEAYCLIHSLHFCSCTLDLERCWMYNTPVFFRHQVTVPAPHAHHFVISKKKKKKALTDLLFLLMVSKTGVWRRVVVKWSIQRHKTDMNSKWLHLQCIALLFTALYNLLPIHTHIHTQMAKSYHARCVPVEIQYLTQE